MARRKLLWSPTAIGVFIWNKARREFDEEQKKWVVVKKDRSEWVVRFAPELGLLPLDQWRAARRKIAATRQGNPLTGRKWTRNERNPSTLFSGTLFCECCENNELKLTRSVGNCQQLGSQSGIHGVHGCRLTTSKSARIIEECQLGFELPPQDAEADRQFPAPELPESLPS